MVALKNIQPEQVLSLAGQVTAQPGQIVSLTLFAFSKGEEISTHESQGDALVQVLEGVGRFTVDGTDYVCRAGESLVMPAQKPHAVYGEEAFKMLLTVVFPPEAQ